MAEITRRRTGEFMRALFSILLNEPDGLAARESMDRLSRLVSLTAYESGSYESGGRRFEKIVRFATVDCVKAGWMVKNKGIWSATEAGRAAYEEMPDPEVFYRKACRLYQEWRATQPDAAPEADEEASDSVSGKGASVTFEEAQEQAQSEIAQYLGSMKPYDFQDLVAELLEAMGYHVIWNAPPGKDGGVDLLAWPDPLGTKPPRLKVQVKRQQATITTDGLRAFMAVLHEGDVGLFVSLGGFTRDAQAEARNQQFRRVTLIDMNRLVDLWVEHYPKLSDKARRRLPLKPIYFLAPSE